MAKDMEKKNIRSDKVRNIMMEKPPLLIRYGTVIIASNLYSLLYIDLRVMKFLRGLLCLIFAKWGLKALKTKLSTLSMMSWKF